MSEVYVRIEESSEVDFAVTPDGAPDLTLELGRLRVLDTREDATAPRYRLAIPHARASGLGTDSEAYVLLEKADFYAMLCEWEKGIGVARPDGAEAMIVNPGECIIAKFRERLYKARAHDLRIALLGVGACETGAILGPVASRFTTTDVAAPPPPTGLLPPAPPAFKKEPCESPGSGCLDVNLGVVESPTTPGTIPGVGGP
jgi:hypothetical protein